MTISKTGRNLKAKRLGLIKKSIKMKTLRVMAIIGIVWFSISFLCIAGFQQSAYYGSKSDVDTLAGWGYLAVFYALALAIVILVKIKKDNIIVGQSTEQTRISKLNELNDLRQKGILNEDEFQAMKMDILKK